MSLERQSTITMAAVIFTSKVQSSKLQEVDATLIQVMTDGHLVSAQL